MKHVKIYIYTSIRTMKKNSGAAGYVLSYTTKSNLEATLSNIEYLEDMSVYDSEIEILYRALKRLNTKSLIVDIYAESKYLESAVNYWLDKWEVSGWVNAKGEPVRHADEWQRILELLEGDEFYINNGHNEYSNWLKDQCEKKGPDEK